MDGMHMVHALGLLREAKGMIDTADLVAGPGAGQEAHEMMWLLSRVISNLVRDIEAQQVGRMGLDAGSEQ